MDFFAGRLLKILSDFVEGEICKVLGTKEDIEKLTRRLARIRAHLQAADQKRYENAAINTWVTELKDITYDIEDVIDDCMLEGGHLVKAHLPPSSSSSSSAIVSLSFDLLSSCFECTKYHRVIASRIKELNNRLKEISEDSQITSRLAQYSMTSKSTQDYRVRYRETTPLEVNADIVGTQIEEAAEDLINSWILNKEEQKGRKGEERKRRKKEEKKGPTVVGIVGMGGIGKTTLARKIMNDKRIKENFPIPPIWLHVSKNYSETRLLKQIVKGAGGNADGAEGIQELEDKVVSILNQNFFIVLDDVWSINVWNDLLRTPILNAVANNGKILVTSRDETIISSMKASHTHHIGRMNEDDGWKLLCKIVFEDDDSNRQGLDDIGTKILELCGGLPLAIKAIAGVLASKDKKRREWEKVLKSDLWCMNQMDAEIPKALYLSYEDLPSHLKECFLSCALYNGISYSFDLLKLWVAEGFITEQDNMLMEEVAEEYYKQLLRRNLLQPNPLYVDQRRYYMHDLLRSLGANLIREEGIIMSDDQSLITNPLTKIRRLSLLNNKGDKLTLPSIIMEQRCLRVLLLYDSYETKTVEVSLLGRLQNLRILDISNTQIGSLPYSLFELVHLRYLDLTGTEIHEIPEAIGRLTNLQTLNISGCQSLCRLPDSITKLCNLRCLRLYGSPLTHLPKGIGRLTNLNHVTGFVIGHDNDASRTEGCDLEELQSFSKMRFLRITRLERATMTGTSVLVNNTMFLRCLKIEWTKQEGRSDRAPVIEEQIERAEKICSELIPPSTIEFLDILNFPGRRFPDWIMSISLGTTLCCLTYLQLLDCSSCRELPPLGRLPQLKYVRIRGAEAIKTIGPEFLGCSSPATPVAFPKLEDLIFENMPNWEEWWLYEGEEGGDLKLLFPTLQQSILLSCPKLRSLPDNLYQLTNLKSITVSSSDEYIRREYSRYHSALRLVPHPSEGPPDWATELMEEELEVAPSAPRKILFRLNP